MYSIKSIKKIYFSLSGAGGVVEEPIFNVQRASTAFHSAQRENSILVVCFSALIFLTASCVPIETSTHETQIVNVYATPATQPWFADVFACAPSGAAIRVASDPISADISLRLGEPDFAPASVYQIDTEEILVVTHRQSPVQTMTVEDVRELFAGGGDPSVQVWVYASGEDVQRVFEQTVMDGRSVTSLARLAVSPGHMSDALNNEPNTVGILPLHWKAGDSRFVFTIPDVPVLAIAKEEPQGAIQEIIACLQK
jgi:hypothetical protein